MPGRSSPLSTMPDDDILLTDDTEPGDSSSQSGGDDDQTLVTKDGLKRLKDELEHLKTVRRAEVAQRLRQHPQMKKTWLIAITGYGQASDRQRSLDAGFDYHLVKPVNPQKLQELLTMLTAQERPEK